MKNKFGRALLATFAVAVLAIGAVPGQAGAVALSLVVVGATQAELQAQLTALQEQITALQGQIQALGGPIGGAIGGALGGLNAMSTGGTGTAWCHTFNVNLYKGNSGSEVTALQRALESELVGYSLLTVEPNIFGAATFNAVVAFQNKYKAEILTPAGLTQGNGIVFWRTRAKLNQLYGCTNTTPPTIPPIPTATSTAPVITSIDSTGIITPGVRVVVNGYNFNSASYISFDRVQSVFPIYQTPNTLIFVVPTNMSIGTHTIMVMEKASDLVSNKVSLTIWGVSSDPSITVLSPNGGEILQSGKYYPITWKRGTASSSNPVPVDIYLAYSTGDISRAPWTLAQNVQPITTSDKQTFNWNVPYAISGPGGDGPVPNGDYRVRVCPVGVNGSTSDYRCDSSDRTFSVTGSYSPPTSTPPVANRTPVGTHDVLTCSVVAGWTCDPDSYTSPLTVKFYMDGPAGRGTLVGSATANLTREAAVGAACGGGTSAHGFSVAAPTQLGVGTHSLYVYGVDRETGGTALLTSSPKSVTCTTTTQPPATSTPPTPVPGPEPNGVPTISSVKSLNRTVSQLVIGQTGYITGTGFLSSNTLTIDNWSATVASTDGTHITFTVPSLAVGLHVLQLTNASGASMQEAVVFYAPTTAVDNSNAQIASILTSLQSLLGQISATLGF